MSESDRDPFYLGHMLDHARWAVAKTGLPWTSVRRIQSLSLGLRRSR